MALQLKTVVNGTKVSTVLLPIFVGGGPYETCLFFANGDSVVVDRYDNSVEAHKGHLKWCAQVAKGYKPQSWED